MKKHAALREMLNSRGARRASILEAMHAMFDRMEVTRWYVFSRYLAELQRKNEEKRLTEIAATHTMELPALPKPVRARLLLFGEEVEAAMAGEDKQERHTPPFATRKLHKAHFIETEQRAAVKKEEA